MRQEHPSGPGLRLKSATSKNNVFAERVSRSPKGLRGLARRDIGMQSDFGKIVTKLGFIELPLRSGERRSARSGRTGGCGHFLRSVLAPFGARKAVVRTSRNWVAPTFA